MSPLHDIAELQRMLEYVNLQIHKCEKLIFEAIEAGDSKAIQRRSREEVLLRSMAQSIRDILISRGEVK